MLKAHLLCKNINKRAIFNNITFEIASGDCLVISGPNGCGKSILLKMLMRLISPSSGNIEFNESVVYSYAPTEGCLDSFLSVSANMRLWYKESQQEEEDWGLNDFFNSRIESLSTGQRKRVLLSRAFANRQANLLLLDEPLMGLDAVYREKLAEKIEAWCKAGKAIAVATNQKEFYEKLQTRSLDLT